MAYTGSTLKRRRAIINRQALLAGLEHLAEDAVGPEEARQSWLPLLKKAHTDGRAEVERRFLDDQDGALAVLGNCFLMDQILRCVYDTTAGLLYPAANPTDAEKMTIVAVGGYGRGELAPQSDIDLLFLHDYKLSGRVEQIVETVLYTLWDMGLKVGQSTRSVDECIRQARADWTICTALLECRFVWGDKRLFNDLRTKFDKNLMASKGPEFLDAKLAERDQRHDRMGDSRYVMEPNIKDGKGGLRDLHALYWTAKFLYRVEEISELVSEGALTRAEVDRFAKAQSFLWTVRCHLHYLTSRPEERLTFDTQPALAQRMGYTDHAGASGVERFMKHYFLIAKDVGDLTRIFIAAFELDKKRRRRFRLPGNLFRKDLDGFPIDSGRLAAESDAQFSETPSDMLRIFKASVNEGIDLHPAALAQITRTPKKGDRALRNDPAANRLFLDILTATNNPEATLRHMNECGLFGRFVPDFGRVVAQMQYDMYHVYTTDEHTIRAIGILHRIEKGLLKDEHPVSSAVIQQVQSREVLYVSVLLHDIAKGRGGDHSELGAKVALKLCPRLGLSDAETKTVSWLVLQHLLMSQTATKRDLDDPKTIADFVDIVQSPERLRLLLCLTVADIKAVGPNVWNNWKATLLRELFWRAEAAMSGSSALGEWRKRAEHGRQRLESDLGEEGWTQAEIESHLDRCPPRYILSNEPAALVTQAKLVREAELRHDSLTLKHRVDPAKSVTEVTIYCPDHPGLIARLSGALALAGASIVDAKIATLSNGSALDTFLIQDADGGPFDRPDRLARLATRVDQALRGELDVVNELETRHREKRSKRTRGFKVSPRVMIDNKASNTHSVIEVNGRDRAGLLSTLTYALTELGLQVSTAKISTYGEEVVDVFYVKDIFGMKIDHPGKVKQIKTRLMSILEPPTESPPTKASTKPAKRQSTRKQKPRPAEAAE